MRSLYASVAGAPENVTRGLSRPDRRIAHSRKLISIKARGRNGRLECAHPPQPEVLTVTIRNPGRRRFLGYTAAAAAIPLVLRSLPAGAADPALPKLPLDHPQAKALGYSENAATVKHPTFKAGSSCANCTLYKGTAGQASGPCALFPQNTVAAKGWCSAWAKKA